MIIGAVLVQKRQMRAETFGPALAVQDRFQLVIGEFKLAAPV